MKPGRKLTRAVRAGDLVIGGGSPVSVQSMTKTDTRDVTATAEQIAALAGAGCELVRLAVPDREAAQALGEIRKRIPRGIPIAADIHFDYRLALLALEMGVDKLRLNPGNIGGPDRVKAVVTAARERGVPIRIGVNAGSLERDLLEKYGHPTAEALAESALRHVRLLEDLGYDQIVISAKAADVPLTARTYELLSERVDYPLHVGITEAGTPWSGTVKSATGLGAILWQGIGDTIRVSLTGDPLEEVRAGFEILKALDLRQRGAVLVSCPTCGRTEVDLIRVAQEVERRLAGIRRPLKVAVMGCVVNGPGEAREADVGLAAGQGRAVLFRGGEPVRVVSSEDMVDELCREVALLTGDEV